MTDKKLFQLPALTPGGGDLLYLARADGSADGSVSFTALTPVLGGVLSGVFAPLTHSHSLAQVSDAGALSTYAAIAPGGDVQTLLAAADFAAVRADLGLGSAYDLAKDADGALTANSDARVATQKAVKTFVAAAVAAGVADGDKGDVVVSSGGTVWTVDAAAVSLSKIVNATANSKILGSGSSGSGASYSELTVGDGLAINSTTVQVSAIIAPQGRLTLTSNTPVLTADTTGQGTIYYTPYVGNVVPIYDGTNWAPKTFAQISLTLNSTDNVSTNLYDIFVFNNSGTLALGTGPAWSTSTSRGTGAGTTELEQKNGIWTNKNSITPRAAGSSLGSVAANKATYLGTAYMTANGQTGMNFIPASAGGGCANVLGLYNAYNRVAARAMSRDSTATWTYASSTWRAANNSNSNRISWVDGLQQSSVFASYNVSVVVNAGLAYWTGVSLDSVSTAPQNSQQSVGVSASIQVPAFTNDLFRPQLGFHFIQAMESSNGSTVTFEGARTSPSAQLNALTADLMM